MEVAKPIIRKIDDTPESLKIFEEDLCSYSDENVQEIITSYPTVYIHNWKESDEYEVYIGESNNVIQRTRQHYETGLYNANSWQNRITGKSAALYIIGHEHFNKSMTLDVENRLMHYMLSVPKVRKVHNLRGNPQNHYYPMEELDRIFSKIWRGLRKDNKDLFPTESMIHDSAIFKASPLHNAWNGNSYRYTLSKENAQEGETWYARAYLVYTDAEGNVNTIYGKIILANA